MIKMSSSRCAVLLTAALMTALIPSKLQATPYASGVVVSGGNVSFYINESGGDVVVTFEDGSTNASFDGIDTGTNMPSGQYSFNLSTHTTYAITVTKAGAGAPGIEPNVIQNTNSSVYSTNHVLQGFGDPRGLAVNANPTSPYFGRIYVSRGGTSSSQTRIYDMNSDGSWSSAGIAGSTIGVTTWSFDSHVASPDRISIAANDDLIVGDWSTANAGVWLADPDLTTNELILGPVGSANGEGFGVHGSEIGRPVLLGSLDTGATLLTVDADFPSSQPNSILVYSNLTWSALSAGTGWQNPPSLIGPQVALNLAETLGSGFYFYPSLVVGPNGYIYSGEFRSGVSAGDPADVQVYGFGITNRLWTSRYNGGSSDYFFTAASGGSTCNPTDLAVSPDGKYLAAVGVDNHFTVCSLTNGIPDVSTIFTIKPDRFGAAGSFGLACEVAWDAADNLYILSSANFGVKSFTLGKSTSAVTEGTSVANTSTYFNLTVLNTEISVYATNNSVISQANSYGNPTSGSFTIVRSGGNLAVPLTVNFTYGGTATNGTYTAGSTGSVTFAANQTTTNISIAAVTDAIPRRTINLTITVTPSPATYAVVGAGQATISILNTATPYLTASVGASSMYNAFSNDYASAIITRLGDTNTSLTVNNFTTAGTGVVGTDYTIPSPVTFGPGDLTKTTYIHPLVGGQLPVHSLTLPYTGNKTAIIGLGAGSGYTPATNKVTLTIVDSATPPATVLYADPLSDPSGNDAANWNITAANGNMGNEPTDVQVQFGYDLTSSSGNTYPIPFPPNGSQYALRMTVNKGDGLGTEASPMTAVNAYLTNQTFGGNYAIRFNMNVIETGNFTEKTGDTFTSSGTYNNEEGALFGFNHNGIETNWYAGDSFRLGAGQESWAADGIFFWVSDSGGSYLDTFSPFEAFAGNGSPSTNAGWALLGGQSSATFATAFKTNVFTSAASKLVPPYDSGWTEGGPGLAANGSANYGLSVSSWSDVEIRQLNGIVTLLIDKTPIFTYTNKTIFTSGFLMLGYEDPYNGTEDTDAAVYYSNLRVVAIGGPSITGITASGGLVTINFAISDDDSNAFKVYSASTVNGTYANVASATITSLGGGAYQAVVPQNGAQQFYRILQQ